MRIFLIIALLFTASCESLHNAILKGEFEQKLKDTTKISSGLESSSSVSEVKIVKAKNIKTLTDILIKFQKEMPDYYPLAITKHQFCTYNGEFIVNEDSLREFAKSKKYELVIYVKADGVRHYVVYKDNLGEKIEKIKIGKSEDCGLFEAYFYSKEVIEINPTETITY